MDDELQQQLNRIESMLRGLLAGKKRSTRKPVKIRRLTNLQSETINVFQQCRQHAGDAAEQLGISEQALLRRIRRAQATLVVAGMSDVAASLATKPAILRKTQALPTDRRGAIAV